MPFRPALEHEIHSWNAFKKGLKPEDRKYFDELMNYARHHGDAGLLAARPLISETIFMAIAMQQEKQIHTLNQQTANLQEELKKNF